MESAHGYRDGFCINADRLLISALYALLVALPCFAGMTFTCKHDDQIDPNVRSTIHAVNARLIESMQQDRPEVLLDLLLDKLRAEPNCTTEVTRAYSQFKTFVDDRDFKVFTECHIITTGSGEYSLDIPSMTQERFMIHAKRLSPETCMCFLISEGYFFDYMISLVYSKMPSGWRVQKIHIGLCRIAGLWPRQWYQRARKLYDRGDNTRSYLSVEIARVLLRPSPFMDYQVEDEVADVYKKFTLSFHSHLYQELRKLPTVPRLYNVTSQFIKTEFIPRVTYISSIPLDDTNSLKKETAQITASLNTLCPDIARDASHIAYVIYRQLPSDANRDYPSKELLMPLEPNTIDANTLVHDDLSVNQYRANTKPAKPMKRKGHIR
jgi:hypothetical protein